MHFPFSGYHTPSWNCAARLLRSSRTNRDGLGELEASAHFWLLQKAQLYEKARRASTRPRWLAALVVMTPRS